MPEIAALCCTANIAISGIPLHMRDDRNTKQQQNWALREGLVRAPFSVVQKARLNN